MPFWRIYYPLNDLGFITHHNKKQQLKPGHIYLIAPESPFSCRKTDGTLDKIVCHFLLEDDFCNCCDTVFDFPADAITTGLAEKLISKGKMNTNTDRYSDMCSLAFCSAVIDLLPPEYLAPKDQMDPRLRAIRSEIRSDISREYKNAELAKKMGVSTSIFVRSFSAAFGKAPQQYILEERLRQASTMLLHSDLSIEEIAEKTGFCDRYYFTRAFTKFRYISPGKFRKGSTQA
ncbi:MAG: helix-turn-helix transcriptional regulator [Victivallales bacterium]|nr:helix-turn-helix transcriptional regulator [Victivallales bacterium]